LIDTASFHFSSWEACNEFGPEPVNCPEYPCEVPVRATWCSLGKSVYCQGTDALDPQFSPPAGVCE
jgi:hypothetical protein